MTDPEHPEACDPAFSPGHPSRPGGKDGRGEGHGRGSGDGHGHAHAHGLSGASDTAGSAGGPGTATGRHRRRLLLVLVITLAVVGVQLVGALVSGSLALLADAGHMLTDATGVGIALVASLIAGLPATSRRTYGYLRVEVLAALANGIVLGVIAVVIFVEAVARFGSEVEIQSEVMLIAAVIGAIANLVSLLILQSGQKESLNVRGAYLEVLGDLLGSIAVIVAGVVILLTGWNWVDQIASILIALMIAPRAFSLLREVVDVLLEATPRGFDLDAARRHMLAVPGVTEVHDVHAWVLTSGVPTFSAHVTVADETWNERGYHAILDEMKACLRGHFDVEHTTLQLEPEGHRRLQPHSHP
ncbi:cation diffusion facilitator family transporter [Leucobacter soli]|uniref:Metal cation efflux system protein CzcD n=1 Tax=Leucobacter soli TaxID=2812850 RepID=A0A916NI82_9MICO|nr:cation diffusion facilitator family transporter [Leucobacter soli]CAG7619281.1 Metal cation efflux system protein CzcD [Leucobacter soli]